MKRFDEVQTERLLMRRWRADDVDAFAALNADPEVMQYFVTRPDRAQTERGIAGWEARFELQGYGLWAIERVDDHVLLGMTGLNPVPPKIGVEGMEVGWRFARHAWGHGYATEAANAALAVARKAGLRSIWSFTAVVNTRSQAVMQRLGLTLHEAFEHPDFAPGHPLRPHVLFHGSLID